MMSYFQYSATSWLRRRDIAGKKIVRSAFTLMELRVATALVATVLVVLLSLTTTTMEVTEASQARMQAGGGLRGALDRMSVDFSSGLFRDDLVPSFEKRPGNDSLSFYAAADGYNGDRGISRIGYRVFDGNLERGATGAGWTTATLKFGNAPLNGSPVAADNYDLMAEYVFRMEVDFLMEDGRVQSSPAPLRWDEARAVIVTLAMIDKRALQRFGGAAPVEYLEYLASLFPDPPKNDARAIDLWSAQLRNPGLFPGGAPPASALQGLHVRERIFPIRQ